MFLGKVQLNILDVEDGFPSTYNEISRALPIVIWMAARLEILLKLSDMVSDNGQRGAHVKRASLPIHRNEDGRFAIR